MVRTELTRRSVEAFRDGEAQALADVIRLFTPLVRSIVNRFWSSEFEREEAAHLVWLHAYERRADVDPDRHASFAGWLATLARHRSIDRLRKQGRQIGPDLDDPQRALDALPAKEDAEQALRRKELKAILSAFAAKLEPDWREFFELHFLNDLDYSQVQEKLDIGVRRCKYMKKVLLDKARRHAPLRQALGLGEDG